MSVTLNEVLESAGYEVNTTYDDANWLLSKRNEFEQLIEEAERVVDEKDEEDV